MANTFETESEENRKPDRLAQWKAKCQDKTIGFFDKDKRREPATGSQTGSTAQPARVKRVGWGVGGWRQVLAALDAEGAFPFFPFALSPLAAVAARGHCARATHTHTPGDGTPPGVSRSRTGAG